MQVQWHTTQNAHGARRPNPHTNHLTINVKDSTVGLTGPSSPHQSQSHHKREPATQPANNTPKDHTHQSPVTTVVMATESTRSIFRARLRARPPPLPVSSRWASTGGMQRRPDVKGAANFNKISFVPPSRSHCRHNGWVTAG